MPVKGKKEVAKAKNIAPVKEIKAKQEVKIVDSVAKLTSILSVFEAKSSEAKGKDLDQDFKQKVIHSVAKTMIEASQNPESIPNDVKQNMNLQFFNRLFQSYNFQSYKASLNSTDNIYDQKILEIMALVDQKLSSIQIDKKAKEAKEQASEQAKKRISLINKSNQIKQSKQDNKTTSEPTILESDINTVAAPDQYLSSGRIHDGERYQLPEHLADNILPYNFKAVIKDQVLSCITNEFGFVTSDSKLNANAAEIEKGMANYALEYHLSPDREQTSTKVIGMVKFPTFSKSDSDLKVDLASVRVDQNITQDQLKLLEIYFKVAKRIYPHSEDSILLNSITNLPKSIKELYEEIEKMDNPFGNEIINNLTEYLAITKTLKEKISQTSLDILSANDIDIELENVISLTDPKALSSLNKLYIESCSLLKKLENQLITKQRTKINLLGAQIKTSVAAAQLHQTKNNTQVPVAVGNTTNSLNTINNSDSQLAQAYKLAIDSMCKELF